MFVGDDEEISIYSTFSCMDDVRVWDFFSESASDARISAPGTITYLELITLLETSKKVFRFITFFADEVAVDWLKSAVETYGPAWHCCVGRRRETNCERRRHLNARPLPAVFYDSYKRFVDFSHRFLMNLNGPIFSRSPFTGLIDEQCNEGFGEKSRNGN